MWLKKLIFRRFQFLLIGIMLIVIATVFCTCIAFTMELRTYGKNRFSKEYSPDSYVYTIDNIDYKENFPIESVRKNFKSVSLLQGKSISVPIIHDDINISSITTMLCTLEDRAFDPYIDFQESNTNEKEPKDGEIWIVKTMASSYGIEIGDTLIFDYTSPIPLKVSAIFTATFAPSERLTIMPNIVNKNTLSSFEDEPPAGIYALNLYDASEEKFDELAMSNPYALISFSRDTLSEYVTNISGVVGGIAAIAAFIVFIASLFIIRFIINNHLQKEISSIGIYKSLGYTSKSIIHMYMIAYVVVGSISVVIGALLSLPLVSSLGKSSSIALGGFKLSMTSIIVCMVAVLLLISLLSITAKLALNIRGITPVEAISSGQNAGEVTIRPSLIKSAKTSLATEINDIFKHVETSVVSFVVLTISIYLIFFFSSSYYTCKNIYSNANVWLACPTFNVSISGKVTENIVETVRENKHVKSAVYGEVFYYPPIQIPQFEGNTRTIEFIVLDEMSSEVTNISMKNGGNPKYLDEIGITATLLEKLDKKIGDYLRIEIGDQKFDYLITGSFVSMEDYAIIMSVDGMRKLNKEYIPKLCYVTLNDMGDFDEFKASIESQYASVSVDKGWNALQFAVQAIENMLTRVMSVMLVVFVIFSLISIVNILALTINSKRKRYGILKSLGFPTIYIVKQNLFRVFILFGLGTVLATGFHLAFSKKIFAMIIIDAMVHSGILSTAILIGTLLLIAGVTLLLCLPIWSITPVNLMEE